MMELLPSDDGWEAISISMPKELQSSLLEISLSCKIDDEVINKFLAHFTFADVIRIWDEHCELPIRCSRCWMRRNSAKWLLYPHAYCGASTLLFLHPSPFPTLLQSSFFLFHPNICSSTLYYLSTYILQCMKRTNFLKCIYRMDYNTLRLNGRVCSGRNRTFFHPLAALHVCIFLCIRTFFLGQKSRKVGHVLFMHLGFLSS